MVQVMLENGFARFMLLDDLSRHPTLDRIQREEPRISRDELRETASSPVTFETRHSPYPVHEQKVLFPSFSQVSNSMVTSTGIRQEASSVGVGPIEDDDIVEEEEEEDIRLTSKPCVKRRYDHHAEEQEYRDQLMSLLSGEPEIVPIGVNSNDEPSGSNSDSAAKKAKSVGDYHECQLCGVRVKTPRSGRWNLQMHVIALHCVGRQYKCKQCDYLDYRKSTMRKHTVSQHGSDIPPHNITDNIMKAEWHAAMIKCFPEFAHRTGFLN